MLDAKLLKPQSLNGDSLPGPLIIGIFQKRAPGPGQPIFSREI